MATLKSRQLLIRRSLELGRHFSAAAVRGHGVLGRPRYELKWAAGIASTGSAEPGSRQPSRSEGPASLLEKCRISKWQGLRVSRAMRGDVAA